MRITDFVAGLGGEEFAAMFSGTLDDGILVAERVRVAFETAARTVSGRCVGATVSVGVAAHPAPTNIDAMLARADEALYAAKVAGRNRVEAELPHVDVTPTRLATATAGAPLSSDNTIAWSGDRRPRGTPGCLVLPVSGEKGRRAGEKPALQFGEEAITGTQNATSTPRPNG